LSVCIEHHQADTDTDRKRFVLPDKAEFARSILATLLALMGIDRATGQIHRYLNAQNISLRVDQDAKFIAT